MPPPKVTAPILKKDQKSSNKILAPAMRFSIKEKRKFGNRQFFVRFSTKALAFFGKNCRIMYKIHFWNAYED